MLRRANQSFAKLVFLRNTVPANELSISSSRDVSVLIEVSSLLHFTIRVTFMTSAATKRSCSRLSDSVQTHYLSVIAKWRKKFYYYETKMRDGNTFKNFCIKNKQENKKNLMQFASKSLF